MAFKGTIDATGYTPPAGVSVFWSNGAVKFLDPSKPFAGWHDSDIPRYGGGDQSLAPHHPSAVGVEQRGGEAFAILVHLFEQAGVGRQPNEQETSDFAVVHGGRRVLTRADWRALAGVESPIQEGELGTARNPIIVNDPRFPKNHVRRIAGKVYMNDLDARDAGPFPDEAKPADPPPPDPPGQSNPPQAGQVTHQIDYRFDGREEIVLPPGARRVVFTGELLLGGPVREKTRSPILGTKIGPKPPKGKRRFDAGTVVLNAEGGLAIEANDKPRSAGGPALPVGTAIGLRYEWEAGVGSQVAAEGRRAKTDPIPALAPQGGLVVLGVERTDDPEADYVLLPPGSSLRGTLTISSSGATQPTPIDPLPLEDAARAAIELLRKALEG